MNLKDLLEELQKLPPQALLNPVRVKHDDYGSGYELTDVVWNANSTTLEAN